MQENLFCHASANPLQSLKRECGHIDIGACGQVHSGNGTADFSQRHTLPFHLSYSLRDERGVDASRRHNSDALHIESVGGLLLDSTVVDAAVGAYVKKVQPTDRTFIDRIWRKETHLVS